METHIIVKNTDVETKTALEIIMGEYIENDFHLFVTSEEVRAARLTLEYRLSALGYDLTESDEKIVFCKIEEKVSEERMELITNH